MTTNIHQKRQETLRDLLKNSNLSGVGLNPGPDLSYLTGLDFHLMERPVLGIFPSSGDPVFILPELEGAKIASLPFPIKSFLFNEDPETWTDVFLAALIEADLITGKLGIIPRRLRLLEQNYLLGAAPGMSLDSAQPILTQMRRIKSEDEIKFMGEAVRIAECALSSTIMAIKPGVTEKEIAGRLVGRLLQEGSDPELPFFPIVSFGENAANPHATPTNRTLNSGDIILIDWEQVIRDIFLISPGFLPWETYVPKLIRSQNLYKMPTQPPGLQSSQESLPALSIMLPARL